MNTVPTTASVVIVGAGPAGLTAAIALTDAGADVVVLDRQAEGANTSRACVIHARTLEVLDTYGVTDRLIGSGITVAHFVVRDGDRALTRIAFDRLPTRYPFALLLGQETTEALLLERLRRTGTDVHRNHAVTGLTPDDTGVTVAFDGPDGPATIRADYVIGADGMHSAVREAAGIAFAGASYPESFVLADVRMSWPDPRTEATLSLSPEGVGVVVPLPSPTDDRYRVVATVDTAAEHPTVADIQAIMDDRRPGAGARVREVLWSSRFRVHHRVAEHFRSGRVLLAGDAAHVHSPAGGQGMNTGIQDAVLLGELLARVVRGESATVLDEYERRRRPVALDVVSMTDKMTRVGVLRGRPARAVRNTAIELITRIPAVSRRLAYTLAELGPR